MYGIKYTFQIYFMYEIFSIIVIYYIIKIFADKTFELKKLSISLLFSILVVPTHYYTFSSSTVEYLYLLTLENRKHNKGVFQFIYRNK